MFLTALSAAIETALHNTRFQELPKREEALEAQTHALEKDFWTVESQRSPSRIVVDDSEEGEKNQVPCEPTQ